jgi:hypothetical protein
MTTFYFHLRSGDEYTLDHEGAEFANYAAALQEVTLAARELLANAIRTGTPTKVDALVIADGTGKELGDVPLATLLPKPVGAEKFS